jgi:hypothetical protein
MLEGALAKILTQAMLTWGRFAAWAFDEASIIKKAMQMVNKKLWRVPICLLSCHWNDG